MDRIETLEKRVAQLEEWRADAEQRAADEGANSSELYTQRQRRLEVLPCPITAHLKPVRPVHRNVDHLSSHDAWAAQLRLRIESLKESHKSKD